METCKEFPKNVFTGEDAIQKKDSINNRQKKGGLAKKHVNERNQGLQGTTEIDYMIEELWELMMKQSRWRKLTAEGIINQNFKLIEEMKMNQKITYL